MDEDCLEARIGIVYVVLFVFAEDHPIFTDIHFIDMCAVSLAFTTRASKSSR